MAREIGWARPSRFCPDPDNRVTLAHGYLDPLGLPRPRIAFKFGEYELKGMKVAMDYVLGIMNALGATNVKSVGPVTDGAVMGARAGWATTRRRRSSTATCARTIIPICTSSASAAFPTITASPPTTDDRGVLRCVPGLAIRAISRLTHV